MLAIVEVFPNCHVHGCWFHFHQSHIRHIKGKKNHKFEIFLLVKNANSPVIEGLNKAYLDDAEFQMIFRMFRMVSLVPEDKVVEAIEALENCNKFDERLTGYVAYFKV